MDWQGLVTTLRSWLWC